VELKKIAKRLAIQLMSPFLAAAKGDIGHLTNSFQVQSERLALIEAELAMLRAEIRNASLTASLLTAAMTKRALSEDFGNWHECCYEPARANDIDFYFREMSRSWPNHFGVWKRLFENGKTSYYTRREASCSHRDHWYARLFGAYIDLHACGRLLDIGCGPHGLPSYLRHYDTSLVSGIEPLQATEPINFEYVRGFNEFLPWPDQAFHTVVSGTSLDHVISLERSLAEVRRVLTSDGRYLVWLASVPGAPAYDENGTSPQAVDEFHMFHFDRVWIEPLFEKYFKVQDVTVISQPGFDHVFYCLQPLK
jgi:SAM-dependent methyltransferase